ncbi:hypothetical protein IAR55_001037 [Kwoniella newhampshirensis]|uniref:BZIP domain-containing protein n=1 Tax=Kwoniella newhampshirensis TaxID=1651941 RepID=A0AAW0Z4N2_9TREE
MELQDYFHNAASFPSSNPSDLTPTMGPYDSMSQTPTMYAPRQQHAHSNHLNRHQHLSHPPVPPSRTSSLPRPSSPATIRYLPSVQVTHPTPTKTKRHRRRSAGAASTSSGSMHINSPTRSTAILPPPAENTLEVTVEPLPPPRGSSRIRPQSLEIPDEEEDSDVERKKEIIAQKQARAREKGRERQRRKRERDKKAKEDTKGSAPAAPLTTATHLPLPSPNPANPLTISVPSPTSSSYSTVPLSASYFSVSPGPQFGLSVGSTSVSGASSPGNMFSPAVSTPGTGFGQKNVKTGFWGMDSNSPSISVALDMPTARGSRNTWGGKARAASTSVPTSAVSRKPPSAAALPIGTKTGPSPAKRRKSEPEPEEFRAPVGHQYGLGVIMGKGDIPESWTTQPTEERPRPRRTASDGVMLSGENLREWSRSPTPPPVPTLPREYQRLNDQTLPSAQANFFASFVVLALGKATDSEKKVLQDHLGVGRDEIEGMKDGFAQLYDKWALERGMSKVSLENSDQGNDGHTSSASVSSAPTSNNLSPLDPGSPPRQTFVSTSFFTPAPRTAARRDMRASATLPQLSSFGQQTQETSVPIHTHGRQRSLSSTSMLARGLHINPQHLAAQQLQQQPQRWVQPETPTSAVPNSSIIGYVDPTSDDTASPVMSSLQTPSTGHGSFPVHDGVMNYQGHWRSATDPTGSRSYTTVHQHQLHKNMENVAWGQSNAGSSGQGLESPLTMAVQLDSGSTSNVGSMPPPTITQHLDQESRPNDVSMGNSPHFQTPNGPRSGSVRNAQAIPYTPPTPLPVRGQNHSALGSNDLSTVPLWFNPTFSNAQQGSGQQSPQQAVLSAYHFQQHGFAVPQPLQPNFGQPENQ